MTFDEGLGPQPAVEFNFDTSLQIRSKQRVRDLAEVYTHQREIDAMLDLVSGMFPSAEDPENIDRTFLEPACGNGNFLVEILRRKLAHLAPRTRYGPGSDFEYALLRCLASIYGLDIFESNVREARERLRRQLEAHLAEVHLSEGFHAAVEQILATNIMRADTLADGATVQFVEYKPVGDGCFLREWSPLAEPELDLFSSAPVRDSAPVHYSRLMKPPEAVEVSA